MVNVLPNGHVSEVKHFHVLLPQKSLCFCFKIVKYIVPVSLAKVMKHINIRTSSLTCHLQKKESVLSTRTSYEYELRVNQNKVQLTRIRDENGKFRSVHADCPNSVPYSPF